MHCRQRSRLRKWPSKPNPYQVPHPPVFSFSARYLLGTWLAPYLGRHCEQQPGGLDHPSTPHTVAISQAEMVREVKESACRNKLQIKLHGPK